MSNYPPGVTGNEPQITGEWPCTDCDGMGYDEDEDGKHSCPWCLGSGHEPEEPPYCKNCGTDSRELEEMFHNVTHDKWCCNLCKDEFEGDDIEWEQW